MEIKRIGENQVRCALTEAEIREMGFEIDDIIGDSEMTQKFMKVVLEIVEEQENINLEKISPMVRAELLQDHSMAITFGGETELSFKELLETVNRLMNQLNPERMQELRNAGREEKRQALESLLEDQHTPKEEAREEKYGKNIMTCALCFYSLDALIDMSKKCAFEKLPGSSLYKLDGFYYLILDFEGFSKDEMRPFALCFVEFDDGHFSDDGQLASIMEQGDCIIKRDALEMLREIALG